MADEIKASSMEPITQDDVNQIKGKGLSYYKLSGVPGGSSVVLEITGMVKVKNAKYPIKDKDYALRCFLGNGQVMDVSSGPVAGALTRMVVIQNDVIVPFKVKITKKVTNKIGESPYIIESVV